LLFLVVSGGPCPVGHYCPGGTSWPLGCEAGTYAATTGLSQCVECLEGYYCVENSTGYMDTPCPTGHYCPNGTRYATEYPCPAGYFNNYTGKYTYVNQVLIVF